MAKYSLGSIDEAGDNGIYSDANYKIRGSYLNSLGGGNVGEAAAKANLTNNPGLAASLGMGEDTGFSMGKLFGDENMMSNITGLAGTVMQAIALPEMLKNAKLQNKSLQFNLDTAKAEQARRNKNIASFNRPTTSAFV